MNNSRQSSNFSQSSSGIVPIYYLEKTKRDIFNQMKSEHPEVKLSLSTFYKLCPKNYKKAQKKTDICQICIKRKRAESSLSTNNSLTPNTIIRL